MYFDIEKRARELAEQYKTEANEQDNNNSNTALKDTSGNASRPSFEIKAQQMEDEQGNLDMQRVGNQYFVQKINDGGTLHEVSIDMAKASMTNDIFGDQSEKGQKYRQDLKDEQKQTIKESFKQDRIREQKATLDNKRAKAESFYLSVRPILEFDFDNLVGGMGIEKKTKEYKDRSYGIPLMVLMLFILVVPYCVVTVILALFNGFNAILKTIATFGKISRYIGYSVFAIGVGALLLYCGILGVEALFNVQILPN